MKVSEDFNYDLWLMLNRTRFVVYKARQKEVSQYGISMRSAGVLRTIIRLGRQITPGKIAREMFLEYHSVSEILSRMEKQGVIKKRKDLEKKNLIRIEITKKGLGLYQNTNERKSTNDIMSVLTRKEKLELWSILSKIRSRAIEQFGVEETDLYPPSDPPELYADD